jgi:hypothetical protein
LQTAENECFDSDARINEPLAREEEEEELLSGVVIEDALRLCSQRSAPASMAISFFVCSVRLQKSCENVCSTLAAPETIVVREAMSDE